VLRTQLLLRATHSPFRRNLVARPLLANAALCIGFTIEITFHKLSVQNACERVALQLYRSTDAMEALGGGGDAAAASVAEHETINDTGNPNKLSDTLLKLRSLNNRKDLVWHV